MLVGRAGWLSFVLEGLVDDHVLKGSAHSYVCLDVVHCDIREVFIVEIFLVEFGGEESACLLC